MADVAGHITIGRPVEEVFDYVADQTNEPQYNPRMVSAEKVQEAALGVGTTFRSAVLSGGRTVPMLIEITAYERPRLLGSTTTMAQADITYLLRFEPHPDGTWMSWSGRIRPKGLLRLLAPVVPWLGNRQERRIWQSLKQHLESAPQPTRTSAC